MIAKEGENDSVTDVELQALGESRRKAMHSGVNLACLLAWPMVTGI